MLALGCLALLEAEVLADTADVVCALTLDALRGTPVAFDERIQAARPHPGQVATFTASRWLSGSTPWRSL
jgi:histidine ammonia-lyase